MFKFDTISIDKLPLRERRLLCTARYNKKIIALVWEYIVLNSFFSAKRTCSTRCIPHTSAITYKYTKQVTSARVISCFLYRNFSKVRARLQRPAKETTYLLNFEEQSNAAIFSNGNTFH